MKNCAIFLSLAAALVSAAPSFAASSLWTIDSDHSAVTFKLKHMSVGTVAGRFKKVSGTVNYDGRNLREAAVEAAVDTQSLDTQSKKRDEHLKSKSFFDANEFPSMSFKSQKIVPGESGSFKIKGIISIHGYAREVSLDAEPLKEMISENGEKRLVTSATTRLDRKDFGISMGLLDRGGALIGDKVQVVLNIQLVNSKSAAGPNNFFHHSGNGVKLPIVRVACDDLRHASLLN